MIFSHWSPSQNSRMVEPKYSESPGRKFFFWRICPARYASRVTKLNFVRSDMRILIAILRLSERVVPNSWGCLRIRRDINFHRLKVMKGRRQSSYERKYCIQLCAECCEVFRGRSIWDDYWAEIRRSRRLSLSKGCERAHLLAGSSQRKFYQELMQFHHGNVELANGMRITRWHG